MPESRSELNRAAAFTRVAREGGAAVSAPARAAFLQSFVDEVDPDRVLEPDERQRRVKAAMRAHFSKMAAKGAASRKLSRAERDRLKAEAEQLRYLADLVESGGAS